MLPVIGYREAGTTINCLVSIWWQQACVNTAVFLKHYKRIRTVNLTHEELTSNVTCPTEEMGTEPCTHLPLKTKWKPCQEETIDVVFWSCKSAETLGRIIRLSRMQFEYFMRKKKHFDKLPQSCVCVLRHVDDQGVSGFCAQRFLPEGAAIANNWKDSWNFCVQASSRVKSAGLQGLASIWQRNCFTFFALFSSTTWAESCLTGSHWGFLKQVWRKERILAKRPSWTPMENTKSASHLNIVRIWCQYISWSFTHGMEFLLVPRSKKESKHRQPFFLVLWSSWNQFVAFDGLCSWPAVFSNFPVVDERQHWTPSSTWWWTTLGI